MTVTIKERKTSRTTSRRDDGTFESQRVFFIAGDSSTPVTTPSLALSYLAAEDPDTLSFPPQVGERHPEDPRLTARTWTIDPDEEAGADGAWIITWFYRSDELVPDGGGAPGFNEARISAEVEVFFIDAWRLAPDGVPGGPTGVPSRLTDIKGTPLDSAGEPVSIPTRNMTIAVTVRQRPPLNLPLWSYLTGRRNAQRFSIGGFAFDAGKLLYRGASINHVGTNDFEVTHNFVADENYHLRQMAANEADGRPKINESESGNTDWKAKHVFWVQPFQLADFGRLVR